MKKIILLAIVLLGVNVAQAQLQKGNIMVGTEISNLNIIFNRQTSFNLTPKAAWFIEDGLAVGAYGQLGIDHINGQSGSVFTYGLGPMARYFTLMNSENISGFRQTKIFLEGNAGIEGVNNTVNNSNTNGLGFGFGPGISYFITPSIGVEALLKYNGLVGFGSSTYTNALSFGIGFQIYLPSKQAAKAIKDF